MGDDDHIRVIVREELNGKVVYRDTCKTCHEGVSDAMKKTDDKVKILDGRMWVLVVSALFQLVGMVVMLLKARLV